jgi:uncharacterized protein (DUF2147 family)
MMRLFLLTVSLLAVTNLFAQRSKPDDIVGTWISGEEKAKIQIYKSGNKYYGKIIWLKEALKEGKPKLDKHNPDPKLRTNPVIGLVVLRDFAFDEGHWTDGDIYDPSSGKKYSSKISMPNWNTLKVRGYIGFSWIGRTEVWKRG